MVEPDTISSTVRVCRDGAIAFDHWISAYCVAIFLNKSNGHEHLDQRSPSLTSSCSSALLRLQLHFHFFVCRWWYEALCQCNSTAKAGPNWKCTASSHPPFIFFVQPILQSQAVHNAGPPPGSAPKDWA